MEIGPTGANRAKQQQTKAEIADHKGDSQPHQVRARIRDLADESRTSEAVTATTSTATLDPATQEKQWLDEELSRRLAETRSGKTPGVVRSARIEQARRRIESGFYDQANIKQVIADKLADQFRGEPLDNRTGDEDGLDSSD